MLEFLLSLLAAVRVFFPRSRRYCSGGPRAPPASRRAQTSTAAADADLPGPRLLDHALTRVAALGERLAHRQTGDRRPVASRRLSPVLALAIPARQGPAADHRGDADSYPPVPRHNPTTSEEFRA